METPFDDVLSSSGYVLLDGGLATQLESEGHDLIDPLWSARLLIEDPDAIRRAHMAFLEAGARCITSASYQATLSGFRRRGASEREARRLMEASYRVAVEARDAFLEAHGSEGPPPRVAASVGPYGAYLADGSEFRGHYGLSVAELVEFHRARFEILTAQSSLLAVETIPSAQEAEALGTLLAERPDVDAWVSFSCRDGEHISDGTRLADAAAPFADLSNVFAIGINCTHPDHVESLARGVLARWPRKHIVAYPNSGERFDPETRGWVDDAAASTPAQLARTWLDAGVRFIGGCCRVTDRDLRRIAGALES